VKLKVDAEGKPVLDGELPVFVDAQGEDLAVNVGDLVAKVNKLSADLDRQRKRASSAEEKLGAYNGIDIDKAREAIETVQNLSDKKLIDAGRVEEIKKGILDAHALQLAEKDKLLAARDSTIRQLSISSKIAGSEWLKKNLLIPADMFEARFGDRHFKLEDEGKVAILDANGNVIMSRKKPGEYADIDEGIEAIVAAYPARDSILKTTGAKGSGAAGGDNGGGGGNGHVTKRSDLKSPAEKAAWIAQQRDAGKDAYEEYQRLPA
jgi:hypothetical protein